MILQIQLNSQNTIVVNLNISVLDINLPGRVPPKGEIKVGEKNEEINAAIAYGVHATVNVTKYKIDDLYLENVHSHIRCVCARC